MRRCTRRQKSVEGESTSRATFSIDVRAEEGVIGPAVGRATSPWVSESVMDVASDSQSDRRSLRGEISSSPCLEDSPCLWVELSEAGASGQGAQRGTDTPMAPEAVAAYKKTPKMRVEALFSSMRVDSCFSRWCDGLGRREDGRRY